MSAGAAVSPTQPSGSSPDPRKVDAAKPGVVLPSSAPSHEDSSQCEFGIYTSCTKPLFFSFLVLDLQARCFLAPALCVRYGVPRGRRLLLKHW